MCLYGLGDNMNSSRSRTIGPGAALASLRQDYQQHRYSARTRAVSFDQWIGELVVTSEKDYELSWTAVDCSVPDGSNLQHKSSSRGSMQC
jgi:hypothetical protein